MVSVNELQRARIAQLEEQYMERTEEVIKLLEITCSQSTALAYFTEDHFRKYLKEVNWNQIVSYYNENNDRA